MREAGWQFERSADEAWPHFHGWRVNYEAAAYALARFLDLPPAIWSGNRPRHRPPPQVPARPPHREPSDPDEADPSHSAGSTGGAGAARGTGPRRGTSRPGGLA
jgi:hypothetical protein